MIKEDRYELKKKNIQSINNNICYLTRETLKMDRNMNKDCLMKCSKYALEEVPFIIIYSEFCKSIIISPLCESCLSFTVLFFEASPYC